MVLLLKIREAYIIGRLLAKVNKLQLWFLVSANCDRVLKYKPVTVFVWVYTELVLNICVINNVTLKNRMLIYICYLNSKFDSVKLVKQCVGFLNRVHNTGNTSNSKEVVEHGFRRGTKLALIVTKITNSVD